MLNRFRPLLRYLQSIKKPTCNPSMMSQAAKIPKDLDYSEDFRFTEAIKTYNSEDTHDKYPQKIHLRLAEYIKSKCQKGNLEACIDGVDDFCESNWMMNLGPEKGRIVKHVFKQYFGTDRKEGQSAEKPHRPIKIIEVGGYCGYSALLFSLVSPPKSEIYTVEISSEFAQVAKQILRHAHGEEEFQKFNFLIGSVSTMKQKIKECGPFDVIFLDHEKDDYLPDLQLLIEYGVVQKGALVIADNIIYPGAPEYWDFFKSLKSKESFSSSVLYHSYNAYSQTKDGVLVSIKK